MKFSAALIAIFSLSLAAAVPTPVQHLDPRASAVWHDPNTYKNNPTAKADYHQKACSALDRAGCAGGTIMGAEHTSPKDGDQNPHVTVKPDGTQGTSKTIHVYPDGTASRKNAKGKTIHFRDNTISDN